MFSKIARRSLLMALTLALFLLPGVAQAGAFDLAGERSLPLIERFQERVQSWADLLWGSISGMREKEGVSIDPNGNPAPSPNGSGTAGAGGSTPGDSGVSIDPNGNP